MSKILVIDDDTGILGAVRMVLEEYGHKVETISDETEVDEAIRKYSPDLILLDILLSGSDGRDISKRLKGDKKTKHIPIILSSAHQDIEKDIIECKADDVLPKPFEIDTLLLKIDKFVKN